MLSLRHRILTASPSTASTGPFNRRVGYQLDRWSIVFFSVVYTLCIVLVFVCNWASDRNPLPADNVNTGNIYSS